MEYAAKCNIFYLFFRFLLYLLPLFANYSKLLLFFLISLILRLFTSKCLQSILKDGNHSWCKYINCLSPLWSHLYTCLYGFLFLSFIQFITTHCNFYYLPFAISRINLYSTSSHINFFLYPLAYFIYRSFVLFFRNSLNGHGIQSLL